MGHKFLTKLPQTKPYKMAALVVLAVGLVGCDAAIEDVEISAKKDLEQKYSERKMKIEKIDLEKDSNGDYNGNIISNEEVGKISYKLNITTDKDKKLVYSITRDKESSFMIAKKCIIDKGFSVESVDLKASGETISGTAVINAQGGTRPYAVEAYVLEDNSSTCSVDFTKESITEVVREAIESTYKELPFVAAMPEEAKMRIDDLKLIRKDATTYSGYMQLKFDGVYGYDRQLEVEVTVDPSDLSLTWKTV